MMMMIIIIIITHSIPQVKPPRPVEVKGEGEDLEWIMVELRQLVPIAALKITTKIKAVVYPTHIPLPLSYENPCNCT